MELEATYNRELGSEAGVVERERERERANERSCGMWIAPWVI
jgi:hypothetical protein